LILLMNLRILSGESCGKSMPVIFENECERTYCTNKVQSSNLKICDECRELDWEFERLLSDPLAGKGPEHFRGL